MGHEQTTMTIKQFSDLDRIKQGHLGVKDSIRADEKINVAYPSSLGPSKTLLAEFMHFARDYLWVAGLNPSEEVKKNARLYAWNLTNYEERFRQEIAGRHEAQAELHRILARARQGFTILLYSREKDWPCHRFLLLDILRAMGKGRKGKPTCCGWYHRRQGSTRNPL
jgi:uncharacterized protein YeaO (DUF488 family)